MTEARMKFVKIQAYVIIIQAPFKINKIQGENE